MEGRNNNNNNNPPRRALQFPGGRGAGAPSGLPPRPLHLSAQPQSSQSQVLQAFHQIAHAAAGTSAANQIMPQPQEEVVPVAAASVPKSKWQRAKWNGYMVKLLVSAVSYIEEDMNSDHYGGSSRMGKWKQVSRALVERGFSASPQQCEDKFHDLNKKYKRVTAILGRGTACDVVEAPVLLEQLRLPAELKDEARKHLSSDNLYYEQMCSYHNRNRISLLHDPQLQRALRRIARGSPDDDQGRNMSSSSAGFEEEFQRMLSDGNDEEEDEVTGGDMEINRGSGEGHSGGSSRLSQVAAATDMNRRMFIPDEGSSSGPAADKNARLMNAIQNERVRMKKMRLKMEQNHLKRMRSIEEKDSELHKMRLENQIMKMENDELELEIEEMEMAIRQKRIK